MKTTHHSFERPRWRAAHAALAGLGSSVLGCLWPAVAWAQEEAAKKEVGAEQILGLLDFNRIVAVIFIMATAWILSRITVGTLDRLGEQVATRRLLIKKISSLVRFGIYIVAASIVVFGVIDPAPSTLLALATALGVVIGLSLQDLIKSIFAGLIVLIDAPFQVGDRVRFGDAYGEVIEIGLRVVRINDLDDNIISIPNGKFLEDIVWSGNAGELEMMVVTDFYIGVDEPYMLAKRLVYEAAITSKYTFLEKAVTIHVSDVSKDTAYATRLRAKLYVIDVRYEVAIITDITERVKAAFRAHNIHAPYHYERVVLNEPRASLVGMRRGVGIMAPTVKGVETIEVATDIDADGIADGVQIAEDEG